MKRTNEEFRAEVFRRKEVYLKARRKRIFGAVLCMPLCFVAAFTALSLAIAMHPAGNAAPGDGNNGGASKYEEAAIYSITESDERFEYMCAFLEEVRARGPESGDFGWNVKTDFKYGFCLGAREKPYYVNKEYIFDGENTFFITDEEYEILLDIMDYKGGRYYEK